MKVDLQVKPNQSAATSKKQQVEQMFDSISGKYDFLNHFLSLNIDKIWRKKTVKALAPFQPKSILDVATGTGDLLIELNHLKPNKMVGLDLSEGMLEVGRKKLVKKGLSQFEMIKGDAENLPFQDAEFDAVTVAFGVRNFEDLAAGLNDINRVLKPGGALAVIEFSQPQKFPVKQLYNFYFNQILPLWGKLFSKSNSAYTYLPNSVKAFPYGKQFKEVLERCGYTSIEWKALTFGICTLYLAQKK